jgi:hypothetical protein
MAPRGSCPGARARLGVYRNDWLRWPVLGWLGRATQSSPELRAGSGKLAEVRREYGRGRTALIGVGAVHGFEPWN